MSGSLCGTLVITQIRGLLKCAWFTGTRQKDRPNNQYLAGGLISVWYLEDPKMGKGIRIRNSLSMWSICRVHDTRYPLDHLARSQFSTAARTGLLIQFTICSRVFVRILLGFVVPISCWTSMIAVHLWRTPGLSKWIKQCPLPSSGYPLATTFVDENVRKKYLCLDHSAIWHRALFAVG